MKLKFTFDFARCCKKPSQKFDELLTAMKRSNSPIDIDVDVLNWTDETENFWKALGNAMKETSSVMSFPAFNNERDIIARYYVLLNQCGRRYVNDPSFRLDLLPLVLEKANYHVSKKAKSDLVPGLEQADVLFYFVKHTLVPMISGNAGRVL